jgi:hypothetical protein
LHPQRARVRFASANLEPTLAALVVAELVLIIETPTGGVPVQVESARVLTTRRNATRRCRETRDCRWKEEETFHSSASGSAALQYCQF